MWCAVCVALLVVSLLSAWLWWRRLVGRPFALPQYAPVSREEAHRLIRQGFSESKVPAQLDVVVVGSGIGGLTTAAVLAKDGKRVLVLEQHDVVGGCLHCFDEKGYGFDTGLHYVGGRVWNRKASETRRMFDLVTDGLVEWHPMHENAEGAYDVGHNLGTGERFYYRAGYKNYQDDLIKRFPAEEQAIKKYFEVVRKAQKSGSAFYFMRLLLPRWAEPVLQLLGPCSTFFKYATRTTRSVLEEIGMSEELLSTVTYLSGDIGLLPSESCFFIHAAVADHYLAGAGYPIGGPEAIAVAAVRVIEKHGGKVFVRSPVSSIVIENGVAVGVALERSGREIRAPIVVSAAGALNTFTRLVPDEHKHLVAEPLRDIESRRAKPSTTHIYLFAGFNGSNAELKLPSYNTWSFPSFDYEAETKAYHQSGIENARFLCAPEHIELPGLNFSFISFPSAKDPTYAERYPGKSACEVIIEGRFEWFEQWAEKTKVKHRGKDYDELKEKFAQAILEVLYHAFPQLKDRVDFYEVGTPLSNNYYLNSTRGESYGLIHDVNRYAMKWLRPRTPIKNLYLSGQDILSCGVAGGLAGGFFCAASISFRSFLNSIPALK